MWIPRAILAQCGAARTIAARRASSSANFLLSNKNLGGVGSRQQRPFSSSTSANNSEQPAPLLVFLGDDDNGSKEDKPWRPPLLWPAEMMIDPAIITTTKASSVEHAIETIHNHYSSGSHFVGGMGESDPGVILAAAETDDENDDILDHATAVASIVQQVKQERHGVPFVLQTTGIPSAPVDWDLWKGAVWQVSLYAASPPGYKATTGGGTPSAFGQVCQFQIEAQEHGMAVEATVVASEASAGRDLALSLGARQVHVVD